jgi:hypothetical protein
MDPLDSLVLLLSVLIEPFEAILLMRVSLMTGKLESAVDWSTGYMKSMIWMVFCYTQPADSRNQQSLFQLLPGRLDIAPCNNIQRNAERRSSRLWRSAEWVCRRIGKINSTKIIQKSTRCQTDLPRCQKLLRENSAGVGRDNG